MIALSACSDGFSNPATVPYLTQDYNRSQPETYSSVILHHDITTTVYNECWLIHDTDVHTAETIDQKDQQYHQHFTIFLHYSNGFEKYKQTNQKFHLGWMNFVNISRYIRASPETSSHPQPWHDSSPTWKYNPSFFVFFSSSCVPSAPGSSRIFKSQPQTVSARLSVKHSE